VIWKGKISKTSSDSLMSTDPWVRLPNVPQVFKLWNYWSFISSGLCIGWMFKLSLSNSLRDFWICCSMDISLQKYSCANFSFVRIQMKFNGSMGHQRIINIWSQQLVILCHLETTSKRISSFIVIVQSGSFLWLIRTLFCSVPSPPLSNICIRDTR